ncbi:BrnT family toxin [Devosia sp. SL43]|uniref:BrnT family toxin n=1 Tax=Devosia sp. SL43 TaxID=2806348 RepID=UPI001F244DBE|nr:BrnT family toxin [Devosia sp. SL43]UJW87535.1 BrnT family toxin [Devosia sp. SL43]
MDYEWDEAKRLSNIEKHKVDILEALLIFENWVLTEPDSRFDYGEVRFKSTGMVDGNCYVLIHAERDGRTRLISAWQGGRRDRRKYQAGYVGRDTSHEG